MTVFGHGPADRDLRILDRFAVSGLDLEFPGMDLAHRHSLGITCVCNLEYSCLRIHGLCVSSSIGRLYLSACVAMRTFAVFATVAATFAVHLAVTVSLTCFAMSTLAVLAALTALTVTLALTAFVSCLTVAFTLACRRVIAITILTALAFCRGIDSAYYRRPCHGPDEENSKKD